MTLAELPAAFAAARVTASTAAKHGAGAAPPNTCRYCGGHIRLFPDASVDGHSRCVVTLAFQRAVYELWWNTPAVSAREIAQTCGVGITVVRKWIANVEQNGRAA